MSVEGMNRLRRQVSNRYRLKYSQSLRSTHQLAVIPLGAMAKMPLSAAERIEQSGNLNYLLKIPEHIIDSCKILILEIMEAILGRQANLAFTKVLALPARPP